MATSKIPVWDPKLKKYVLKTVNVAKDDYVSRTKNVLNGVNNIVKKTQVKTGGSVGAAVKTPVKNPVINNVANMISTAQKKQAPQNFKISTNPVEAKKQVDNTVKAYQATKPKSKTNISKEDIFDKVLKGTGMPETESFVKDKLSGIKDMKPGAGKNVASSLVSLISGIDDTMSGVKQTQQGLKGDESVVAESPFTTVKKQVDPTLSGGAKFANDLVYSGGRMIPAILLGIGTAGAGAVPAVANAIGAGFTGVSSAGSTYGQTVNEGYTPDQARTYGLINGVLEGGLQYALGGVAGTSFGGASKLLGKTGIAKTVASKLAASPQVIQKVATLAARAGDEGTEEYLQAVLDPIVRNITLGENNKFEPFSADKIYQASLGAIMGFGSNIPSVVAAKDIPTLSALVGEEKATRILNESADRYKTAPIEQEAQDWTPEELRQMETVRGLTQGQQTNPQPMQENAPTVSVKPQTDVSAPDTYDTIGRDPNKLRSIYQSTVSAQEPLENIGKIEKQKGELDSAIEKTQRVRNAGGTADYIATEGLSTMDDSTIDVSFNDVVAQIPKEQLAAFNDYAQNNHNISRMAEGKPVNENTAEQSAQIVNEYETKYPEFRAYADKLNSWWDTFGKEWIVKSGLVSQESYDAMRSMYPDYVPTYRKGKGGQGSSGIYGTKARTPKAIGKATGGTSPIIPLEFSFLDRVNKIVKSARLNQLNIDLLNFARQDPEGASVAGVTLAKAQNQPLSGDTDAITGQYENSAIRENKDLEPNNGRFQITAYENGSPVTMNVSKDVFSAVTRLQSAITDPDVSTALSIFRKVGGIFKMGYTGINAVFVATNAIRDFQTYMINRTVRSPFKAVSNLGRAVHQIATKGLFYKQYKAAGNARSGYFGNISRDAYGDITKLPQKFWDQAIGEKIKAIAQAPFNAINKAGAFVETVPRLAEYIGVAEQYGNTPEARSAASQAAADVTTNFSRFGVVTKMADSVTLYLNASVQGLDKVARQMKARPAQTGIRAAAYVVLPSILLAIANAGNPNYDELDDRTKDAYFLIPNMLDLDENGKARTFIKIPRSREYGVILGALTDRLSKATETGDMGEAFKGYWESVWNSVGLPNFLENSVASFIQELSTNVDWAGRSIIPESMKNLEPRYQYDINTSGIAKGIGNMINISPKQIDYVIGQFGYPGKMLQAATSQKVNSPEERAAAVLTQPFERAFTADSRYSSALTDKLYDELTKATSVTSTNKFLGVTDDAAQFKKTQLSAATDMLSELRKYEKEILGSSLTADQKEAATDNLREQMNDVARQALYVSGVNKNNATISTAPNMLLNREITKRKDGTVEKSILNAMSNGIAAQDFYDYSIDIGSIMGDKDSDGDTIANSEGLKKKAYIDALGLGQEQTQSMYDMFQISEKIQSGEVTQVDVDNAIEKDQTLQRLGIKPETDDTIDTPAADVNYGTIPDAPIINGADKVEVTASKMTATQLEKLAALEMHPQDYYYIDEREAAIDTIDKIDWYSSLGVDPLKALKTWDVTAEQKANMKLAADSGIDEDTFMQIYADTRGSMEGSKAQLNEQLTAYLQNTGLTAEQQAFLYDALKFSQKQYKSGSDESTGGSGGGGSGKKAKAFNYSSAAKPPSGGERLQTVRSRPIEIENFSIGGDGDQLRNILNSIMNTVSSSSQNIKGATLQAELDNIENNKLLSSSQKAAQKRTVRERYQ